MGNSIYHINRGINKSIEFKGLKAQYIGYLAGGLVALLLCFAILYVVGIPSIICLVITLGGGASLFIKVFGMSKKYGQYGLMKKNARRAIPTAIRLNSRGLFMMNNNRA